MRDKQIKLSEPAETLVLRQIIARLIQAQERERWDQLMVEHYYLKSGNLVGEQMRYVVQYQGR